MSLVTGTLYAKKSYGRSLFGELVTPTLSQNEAEKFDPKKETAKSKTPELTQEEEKPENSEEKADGTKSEVKVQWRTVGSGGSKQKELGKGFFTPKAYESEDESEQEETADGRPKTAAKKVAKVPGQSAVKPSQPTNQKALPTAARGNLGIKPKYKQPPPPKLPGKSAKEKSADTSAKQKETNKIKQNKANSKPAADKRVDRQISKQEGDETETEDEENSSEEEEEEKQNKAYVIKPIAPGRHSEFLETILEDEPLTNIIDEDDLADIKRDLALKGILSDSESLINKSVSDEQVDNADNDVRIDGRQTESESDEKHKPLSGSKEIREKQPTKTDEHVHKDQTTKQNDHYQNASYKQKASNDFIYPNTSATPQQIVQTREEVLRMEEEDRNKEGFKTNKSFEIRRLQAKYEREKEDKKKSWFRPKFLRSKVSSEPPPKYSKQFPASSYQEAQIQDRDHRKNWIRKKPKSILTPGTRSEGSRRLLKPTSKPAMEESMIDLPFANEREGFSRSSSIAGTRPNSATSWDEESISSMEDDVSLGDEYFEDNYADEWDRNAVTPSNEEAIHQLYEDIDRLDPSRLASYNYEEGSQQEQQSTSRATSANQSATGRSSYHVMNDPNYYLKKQRENLQTARRGSHDSPNRIPSAMSSNGAPLHLFDSMRYEQHEGRRSNSRKGRKSGDISPNRLVTPPKRGIRSRQDEAREDLKAKKKRAKKKGRLKNIKPETPPDHSMFRNGGMAFGPKIYPIPDRKMSPMTQMEWEAEVRKIYTSPNYAHPQPKKRKWWKFGKSEKPKKKLKDRRKRHVEKDNFEIYLDPICYNERLSSICNCMDCSDTSLCGHLTRVFIPTIIFVVLSLTVVFLLTGILTLSGTSTEITTVIPTTGLISRMMTSTVEETTITSTTKAKVNIVTTSAVPATTKKHVETTASVTTYPVTTKELKTTLEPTTLSLITTEKTTLEETTPVQTTVDPTTVQHTTLKPTTELLTTPIPTTIAQSTLPPTTDQKTTQQPTTEDQTTVESTKYAKITLPSSTVMATTVDSTTNLPSAAMPTAGLSTATNIQPSTVSETTMNPTTMETTELHTTKVLPTDLPTTVKTSTIPQPTVDSTSKITTVFKSTLAPTTEKETTAAPGP